MGWLCIFIPHKWIHLMNVTRADGCTTGTYQCSRCKEVSEGAER